MSKHIQSATQIQLNRRQNSMISNQEQANICVLKIKYQHKSDQASHFIR